MTEKGIHAMLTRWEFEFETESCNIPKKISEVVEGKENVAVAANCMHVIIS